LGQDDGHDGACQRGGADNGWKANALFICLKLASAVAAGCTVVIKPSEMSSLQTRVMVEALLEANLPKGLLNVVVRLDNVVGDELTRNPDVDKISFHGLGGRRRGNHARWCRDNEACSTRCPACGNHQTGRVAHLPAHLLNPAQD
jgi:hypothetical protein